MNKYAIIDFNRCNPFVCNGGSGECKAVLSCSHKILLQEEPFESPLLLSMKLCVGCGDCIPACDLKAIEIKNG